MKCFYHNDMDGRCAGAIVAMYENNFNKEDYFEVDYVMPLPLNKIKENERIYLVDYSFKKDTVWQLEEILKKTNDVTWIDHHTSSLNLQQELSWTMDIKGIRADGISGAGLTYMYLYNYNFDEIPYAVKLVSDYDCWVYDYDPETTFFKLGIDAHKHDALDILWKLVIKPKRSKTFQKLIEIGKNIKGYIDKDNDYYRNHFAYESKIEGYRCLVVNKKSNSWIFGDSYNDYPLVMVWVFNGKKYIYSIFSSNPEVDCSKIAEKYGGGGHRGAAGFTSDELLFYAKENLDENNN